MAHSTAHTLVSAHTAHTDAATHTAETTKTEFRRHTTSDTERSGLCMGCLGRSGTALGVLVLGVLRLVALVSLGRMMRLVLLRVCEGRCHHGWTVGRVGGVAVGVVRCVRELRVDIIRGVVELLLLMRWHVDVLDILAGERLWREVNVLLLVWGREVLGLGCERLLGGLGRLLG